jgi:Heterokaryon incompatibility protein (HET)
MDFEYEPLKLSGNSIRLLQIQPATEDNIIRCTISQYPIHNRPVSIAISYTWGDEHNQRSIFVNGRNFRIRKNLWDLLWHLQQCQENRHLWIDALCIYSYRTAAKCCRNLRFRPLFCEGFDSNPQKPVRALGAPLGLAFSCQLHPPNTFQLSLLPGNFESFCLRDDVFLPNNATVAWMGRTGRTTKKFSFLTPASPLHCTGSTLIF